MENRRKGLEEFVKELVLRKDVISSEQFRTFLQLDQHAQEVVLNPPEFLAQFELESASKDSKGVRGFVFDSKLQAVFVVTADMSTVSRLNAALVNSKKPWSTVDPVTAATFTTVGTIECYVCE